MSYIGNKPADTIASSSDIADGAITSAKLASSSVTQPKVNGGVAGTGPAFSAYQSSATSLSNGAYTKVLFANESFDTNNNFASSAFTPTVAGYYQLNSAVGFVNGQTTRSRIVIYKNGSQASAGVDFASASGTYDIMVSSLMYFNGSTDYAEIYVYQSSGSSQNTDTSSYNTYFNGAMVRAA